MADELPNAVALMRDSEFRDWVVAAIGYQARVVMQEATSIADYAVRRKLASAAILDPAQFGDRFINVIATDPEVAVKGKTVQLVGQALLLQKVAGVWPHLAKLIFPEPAA